ncbi:MAG: flagellar basal body L-ring protein FlgH [Bdellovibrionales bacterium]|nr:flagellar basal body L-ring protein FlgH [Bdellovibrionales bacterium]
MRLWLFQFVVVVIMATLTTGCSSFGKKLKAFLGGRPAPSQQSAKMAQAQPQKPSFNSTGSYQSGPRRQYKRVTKSTLAEEARLKPGAGSLWVMEGQGAYLFSENIVRMIGDPVSVQIEGESKEQLESKAEVIKGLLDKLEQRAEARRQAKLRRPASEKGGEGDKSQKKPESAQKQAGNKDGTKSDDFFKVKTVTGRVVERTVDGNYRIKGSQPFMIGPREYKVIVTGIVRAEDFNEGGVSSTKLLDPNFDIVGVKKRMM